MKPSGIEWIGDIPDDWEVTKISRLYSIQLGKMLQPEKKSSGDTYEPYICAANLSSGTFRLDEVKYMWISEPEKDIYRLKRDDLLVTEGGDVGISSIWKDDISPCYFQNALHRVVPKKGNSNRFLHYWLIVLKSVGYIDLICNKSTIAHFTKEKFAQSLILSIPLQTQQRIADYLDEKCGEIDATIAKQKESIEKLKAYKQSLISETVTKGLDKSAPLKPSGIDYLGDIPSHWEIKKLKFLVSLIDNKTKDGHSISLENIESGTGKLIETENTYDGEGISFKENDLLFGKLRPYLAKVYLSALKGRALGDFYVMRANKGTNPNFLKFVLLSDWFIKIVDSSTYGTKMPRASWDFTGGMRIPLPPISEQDCISSYLEIKCSEVDTFIIEKQNIIQKLDAYKKSLIFECVTGKRLV